MNFFPNGDEEINLLKFLAKYQYLHSEDEWYFFKSKAYYKKRVNSLVTKHYLCRGNNYILLGDAGVEYAKLSGFEYNKLNKNKQYRLRLLNVSNIAAYYYYNDIVKFVPSFNIKDIKSFTTKSRKYIGILDIDHLKYIVYYISKEHDDKYIASLIWDIKKEKDYKNIIVFVEDLGLINKHDFIFGKYQVLIIENKDFNKDKLQYINRMHWEDVIEEYYGENAVISEYSFCDYTNHKDKYISYFYFLDIEKVNRIKYFLRENKNKKADILCSSWVKDELKRELPDQNYIIVNMDKYTEKEWLSYV